VRPWRDRIEGEEGGDIYIYIYIYIFVTINNARHWTWIRGVAIFFLGWFFQC